MTNTAGAKWVDDTNLMYTKTETYQRTYASSYKNRGNIIGVLADVHCLFRAVGKILHMESGTVMKEANAHLMRRPSNE